MHICTYLNNKITSNISCNKNEHNIYKSASVYTFNVYLTKSNNKARVLTQPFKSTKDQPAHCFLQSRTHFPPQIQHFLAYFPQRHCFKYYVRSLRYATSSASLTAPSSNAQTNQCVVYTLSSHTRNPLGDRLIP